MNEGRHQARASHEVSELAPGRSAFTLTWEHGGRWSTFLLVENERALLLDPWPWPHTAELMEEVESVLGDSRVRDVVVQADVPGALSALPVVSDRWNEVCFHTTERSAAIVRGASADVSVAPVSGLAASLGRI